MCPPGIRSFFVLAVLLALAAPSAAEVRFDLVVDATELAVDDTVRVDVEVQIGRASCRERVYTKV